MLWRANKQISCPARNKKESSTPVVKHAVDVSPLGCKKNLGPSRPVTHWWLMLGTFLCLKMLLSLFAARRFKQFFLSIWCCGAPTNRFHAQPGTKRRAAHPWLNIYIIYIEICKYNVHFSRCRYYTLIYTSRRTRTFIILVSSSFHHQPYQHCDADCQVLWLQDGL